MIQHSKGISLLLATADGEAPCMMRLAWITIPGSSRQAAPGTEKRNCQQKRVGKTAERKRRGIIDYYSVLPQH